MVDFAHEANGFGEGDDDLLVVVNVVGGEEAAFAILQPLLAYLIAADVELSKAGSGQSSYGPRKRSPLKWIRCSGASATQTSVSQEISPKCLIIAWRSRKAVTNTSPALESLKSAFNSLRRFGSTGCGIITLRDLNSDSSKYAHFLSVSPT